VTATKGFLSVYLICEKTQSKINMSFSPSFLHWLAFLVPGIFATPRHW